MDFENYYKDGLDWKEYSLLVRVSTVLVVIACGVAIAIGLIFLAGAGPRLEVIFYGY